MMTHFCKRDSHDLGPNPDPTFHFKESLYGIIVHRPTMLSLGWRFYMVAVAAEGKPPISQPRLSCVKPNLIFFTTCVMKRNLEP